MGLVLATTTSSGFPRSQPRLSKSPNTWQLEQEASPLLEVKRASYKKGRPATTSGGSGLWSGCCASSFPLVVSTTFTALSKRVST